MNLKISHETAGQYISAKYDAAVPTEALVYLDCFVTKYCFRKSLPFGVGIISYKNNEGVTQ